MKHDYLTDNRYIGSICEKHPELGGLRQKNTRGCIGCQRAWNRRASAARNARLAQTRIPALPMTPEIRGIIALRAAQILKEMTEALIQAGRVNGNEALRFPAWIQARNEYAARWKEHGGRLPELAPSPEEDEARS